MPNQACQSTVISTKQRAVLRREKLAARQALPAVEHARTSRQILDHLWGWLSSRPAGMIAFCSPVRGEVDCRPVIERLIATGWLAAMPVVTTPAAPMVFRPWSPETPMLIDHHGIPIPDSTVTVVPTVALLPLVAFDAAGYRLGYGGGYFDRTLAALAPRPLAVGIGFELAMVDTIHPANHDVPLDAVITEIGLRSFNTS